MSDITYFESGKGYNIAYNVYLDNGEKNTCCKTVSEELEKFTKDTDHRCILRNVIVVNRDGIDASHNVCTLEDGTVIDYCASQFLGNEKEFKLHKFKHIIGDCYLLNNKDNIDEHVKNLKDKIKDEIDISNSEEVLEYVSENNLVLFIIF